MSTADGAIDEKLFYDLEWIYFFLLLINSYANETSADIKILFITSTQHKQH